MPLLRTIRNATLATLLAATPLTAVSQRGPGGPPGGGGPGGAMGAPGGFGGPGSMRPGGNMENRGSGASAMSSVPRYAPTLGPPGRWWDDHKIARNLNLRTDQQRRMDDIFEANKGTLVQLYTNLQREEARLSTMSSADLTDESKVFAAIDRVAQARAEALKANAHILLQIRREMDPSQLAALDKEIASIH